MILPIYAGLERIPASLLEASADLGRAAGTTFRRVVLPLAFPAVVGRLDLHVLADARRLHHARSSSRTASSSATSSTRARAWPATSRSPRRSRPSRSLIMADLPAHRAPPRRVRRAVGPGDGHARLVGLATVGGARSSCTSRSSSSCLYAFNARPRPDLADHRRGRPSWFGDALDNPAIRDGARPVARGGARRDGRSRSSSGSLAALAVHRFRFFGRETISFVLLLPIALPGIVTGMALNATFNTFGMPFSVFTIIVGHATFCVVIVYNNVIARLRRSSRVDRGGVDGPRRRHVADVPLRDAARSSGRRSLAGGLLAFALSFDEVIVTTFTAGHAADAADLDPRQPPAAEPAAARQRGGRGPDPPVRDPGLPVAAPQQRRRRAGPARPEAGRARPAAATSDGRAPQDADRSPAHRRARRAPRVTIASRPPRRQHQQPIAAAAPTRPDRAARACGTIDRSSRPGDRASSGRSSIPPGSARSQERRRPLWRAATYPPLTWPRGRSTGRATAAATRA